MPESLRTFARRALAAALYYSGALWLLAGRRLRQRAIVVMYHRVLPAGADTFSAEGICVEPRTFEKQMAFLKRHFRLLSMRELAEALEARRPLPSRSCVVTFDDGWFDNAEYALPILRRHRIPAVVFAATDFIGGADCFWQERLARRLHVALAIEGEPRMIALRHTQPDILAFAPGEQRRRVRAAVDGLKKQPAEAIRDIERALDAALSAAGVTDRSLGADRFMSWQELASLRADSAVEVGAHGCTHTPLTQLPQDGARRELVDSRARLEQALAAPVFTVGYPNGDFSDDVVAQARAAGYRLGFTTAKGTVGANDDALRIKRVNISGSATGTNPEFLCTMLQVFNALRRQAH